MTLIGAGSSGALGAGIAPTDGLDPLVLAGGCWTYTPDPLTDPAQPAGPAVDGEPLDLTDEPLFDISTALEPWSSLPPDPAAPPVAPLLTTAGDTAVGGTRTFALDLAGGPALGEVPTVVRAVFHFSVDGQDIAPVEVSFGPGEELEELPPVEGSFVIEEPGAHQIALRGVFFDMPLLARRVACNAQTEGIPGGANPATAPLDTNLASDFAAVAEPAAIIAGIEGQRGLGAARAGDTVRVAVIGLASSTEAQVALCDAAALCLPPATFLTEPDGSGLGEIRVPSEVEAGEWTLRVSDAARWLDLPLTLLGTPALTLTEEAAEDEVEIIVEGVGWNPGVPVEVRGYRGPRLVAGNATSDRRARVRPDATGAFSATFTATDRSTKRVGAVQARADRAPLRAAAVFGGFAAVPPPPGPPQNDPPQNDPPASPPATTPSVVTPAPPASIAAPPAEPPLSIPPPSGKGVKKFDPPAEPDPEPVETTLAIGQVTLEGSASFGELFGAAPERTLSFTVQNLGEVAVEDPEVRLVVSKTDDVEPAPVKAGIGTLEPGDTARVEIPIALPTAAFGTYHVRGGVGDAELTAFDLEWSSYPWGLFVLNALGLVLLGWGLRRRLAARGIALSALLPLAALSLPVGARRTPPADGPLGDAVVDLVALEKWWDLRDGGQRPPAPRPRLLGGTPTPLMATVPAAAPRADAVELNDSVVDLAAAAAWWEHRSNGEPQPRRRLLAVAGEPAPRAVGSVAVLDPEAEAADAAIVDLAAADAWWSRQEQRRKGYGRG
ncbi:hypothetical protein GHK92_12935 [Nocardioides sp. dk4132]|uniref:hypothetical protein n=1 Tax=unclassified Nocardioides TaxID=2615069 RepID=UPI0012965C42|nr:MULTISPECIES: hypothetical protein [unclassified Nocardioides]MQW76781.1 hypothetical protein [Nocardioides sp. dk4132]QGA06866.1 hypothetical protein GFH29_05285 [Nocardioides sp. dk884]